jgi:serine/threonine protein kinase
MMQQLHTQKAPQVSTDSGQQANISPTSAPGFHIRPGEVIGKHRVVRDVGLGGMAQVFLAHREGPEGAAAPYVIKRMLPQYAQDEQFAKMFVHEGQVAALLEHPNIVRVLDFEIESGNYYLVMEYVAGASLAKIMRANRRRGTPLGAHIALEVGTAIAHALAYAHELSLPDGRPLDLVHRDISPGNVLISRDGAVKLADFGVVKTSMTETVVGVVNGKWAYMSPEQISGQTVDKRSDLFSLGIVLYEVITGQRLFRAENAEATASRVMNMPIRRPSTVVPDLDPRLDHIVMTMLERDRNRRYQTAAAVAADLEAVRALPQFAAGRALLRTLVQTLFPEEPVTPAPGSSSREAARPGNGGALASVSVGTGPAPDDPEAASVADADWADPTVLDDRPVSRKLIWGIALACVLGSVLIWLSV